jgi:hypothetical protein
VENIEEIVLNKLNTQKRSAFNILNNKELCDRIINENPIWLDDFSKEYGIGKSIIQKLVKNNIISSFSNLKGKGSKIFIFKDEALSIFKLNYTTNEFFESVNKAITLYLMHVKNTITVREYEIIYDVLVNKVSIDELSNKYDLTRTRVKQIFDKANRRLKNAYRISIDYEALKSEYETLNYEVKVLKEKRMILSKSKIFQDKKIIEDLPKYSILKKGIWDFDISVRLLNALRNLDIETLEGVVVRDRSYFAGCRNVGVKSLKELDNLLVENKLQYGMNTYMLNSNDKDLKKIKK